MSEPKLAGKFALVTGGAQGLGAALSERLAKEGANVAVLDLNGEGAQAVATKLAADYGVKTLGVGCDITDEASVAAAFEQVRSAFGRLDLCISNAGILISGPIADFDVAKWHKVVEVNLVGYMIIAKYTAQIMIPQGSGVIVQINSKSGKKGSNKNSAYAASKFGGIGLTQSLALELAEYGIRVNALCPGNLLDSPLWQDSLYEQYAKRWGLTVEEVRQKYVDQVPLRRGCVYEDVANAMVFLCLDDSSYITGQALNVDGGQTMH
ncbi:sorbitol-6-phosphate dehydrogenase [bacterium]|nr:sorbitol-6-phosphate dehydrogenase [bacterium]